MLLFFLLVDVLVLFTKKEGVVVSREMGERFSNGDENEIHLFISNKYTIPVQLTIIEELPIQFQIRDWSRQLKIDALKTFDLMYHITPLQRGEYEFGVTNVYVTTILGLAERRILAGKAQTVKVYPSFLQLRKYALLAFSNQLQDLGIKKVRRIGQNKEFEQIRDYVQGDDIRLVNWKASARRDSLMVNQYQDERSQQVYCLIDKGRNMKMPFNGLSLIDYAINAALVLSNISIQKQDKAGLITFSDKIGAILPAGSKATQMNIIQETLYNQKTRYQESDFGRLYRNIKWNIKRRSLMLLFTNFESITSLNRQIKYFRSIAKDHLLVVVFFKNSELETIQKETLNNITGVYEHTIAEKYILEKEQIVKELSKYGIQSILTEPENLTVGVINKYLEIKARGIL